MATWLICKASWGKTEASGEVRKIQRRGQRSPFSTFNAKVSMKRQLAESRQYKLLLFNLNFSAHSLPLFIYTITMTEKQKVKGQLTKLNYNLGCRNKTVEDTKVMANMPQATQVCRLHQVMQTAVLANPRGDWKNLMHDSRYQIVSSVLDGSFRLMVNIFHF